MKPKTLVLMLVAVGCGLVAAYLASQVGGGASNAPLVPVLVAKVDIPAGKALTNPDEVVETKNFLADTAPLDRIANKADLQNKTFGRTIAKGEPLTAKDFSQHGSLFNPAPPGFRAVTIRVTLDSGLAGFALPGSRVDLVCTRTDPADNRRRIAQTFMENVLVLAVNTLKTGDKTTEATGVVGNPSVVTLAAKPTDVARIIWAKETGPITLSLRRPGEEDTASVPDVTSLNSGGSDGPGGKTGAGTQTVQVWVARETIPPGKMIDTPEKYFMLAPVLPSQAESAYKDKSNPPPADKLRQLVVKGMPVTPDHYKPFVDEKVLPGGPSTPDAVVYVTVRDPKGTKTYKYKNGVRIDGDDSSSAPDQRPAPSDGGTEGPK